jgi:hypothetical protein
MKSMVIFYEAFMVVRNGYGIGQPHHDHIILYQIMMNKAVERALGMPVYDIHSYDYHLKYSRGL